MGETILELIRDQLDSEDESQDLLRLPADFYSKVTTYSRNLRRASGTSNSEVTNRLITRQFEMIEGMVRRLVTLRMRKALSQGLLPRLLPEERYVCSVEEGYSRRFDAFIEAVSSGQSSFLEIAHRREIGKNATVRFVKPVSEVIGMDLRRYGPFKPNDLASIPKANADILVANAEAVEVHPREA